MESQWCAYAAFQHFVVRYVPLRQRRFEDADESERLQSPEQKCCLLPIRECFVEIYANRAFRWQTVPQASTLLLNIEPGTGLDFDEPMAEFESLLTL